ncbi:lipase [Gordonia amicalis]|uniref:lipase family protein n=1 Tax=Gordonia amicalis TaxID=89053 RepID=UPI0022A6718C|nr:lipase family protein [Gordonia amicalis]MCZ0911403.1 lipase [Gordonia amicalis]
MRSKFRRRSRTLCVAATVGVAAVGLLGGVWGPGFGAVARAEPPNLTAVPSDIPGEIDAVVPAPPVKKLNRIPQRSKIEGGSKELQELREAVMPSPVGDRFFDHWPADLAALEPGDLIATRDVTQVAGFLVTVPLRSARQIKFRTTGATGGPLFGTATLFVPQKAWRGPGPRPILVNNTPIVALGTTCTPGYTFSHGYNKDTNNTDLFPPLTQLALDRVYAVIVPDHTGARMAYAEPYVGAHVVLDSVRAAARLDPIEFGRGPIAMHGYSGGAIATNGAAKLASTYAPEQAGRFVGAAIGGVPADYRVLAGAMNANLASGVFHSAMLGVARERPEILGMSNRVARWLATSGLRDLCTGEMGILGFSHLPTQLLSLDPDPFHSPVADHIFDVTSMSGYRATMPLFIYHGTYEWWLPATQARALFAEQCELGATAIYREYPGEHITTVFEAFPDVATWLDRRLQGIPATNECR